MKQGTTPTHTFHLPFDSSNIKALEITYAQHDTVLFTKEYADCILDSNAVTVELTQEDTFKFDITTPIQMQLRVLTITNQAYATDILLTSISKSLSKEVLI